MFIILFPGEPMPSQNTRNNSIWSQLTNRADIMNGPDKHLKFLLEEENRFRMFSSKGAGLLYDFSRQRVDSVTMDLLFKLAEEKTLLQQFNAMMKGEKINLSENRAALHTALRNFSGTPVTVDGQDVMPAIKKVRDAMDMFSRDVRLLTSPR